MPAVNFTVTWPDGEQVSYYSPSTVIHQHLKQGNSFSQSEFSSCIEKALGEASERVHQRFGYYCSSASDELSRIKQKLARLNEQKIVGNVNIDTVK